MTRRELLRRLPDPAAFPLAAASDAVRAVRRVVRAVWGLVILAAWLHMAAQVGRVLGEAVV